VGRYARAWLNQVNPTVPLHIKAVDVGGSTGDPSTLSPDYYAPGPGFFYTRNRWGTSATSVMAQLGWPSMTFGHEHLDAGTFQIWRNGRFLSRETVGYSDSITGWNNGPAVDVHIAAAHNGVLFQGVGMENVGFGVADGTPVVQRLQSGVSGPTQPLIFRRFFGRMPRATLIPTMTPTRRPSFAKLSSSVLSRRSLSSIDWFPQRRRSPPSRLSRRNSCISRPVRPSIARVCCP
jgi:hypothetical protein